ncbi:MAG TPA: hypothetical protein ACFYEK_10145 [Candidatus Wunengus sp. YC60]|uniref:hypothetical protein n=1 Tax=Candidatus Wunengus sp. YC60 TaxID=3367697 RepID=UPI00402893DB
MVKAPEKFLDKYLSRGKGVAGKTGKKASRAQMRKISDEELARLKQNLQTVWGIYCTPEIKEILSKKWDVKFLTVDGINVCLNIGFMDKGILMEYELDMGNKKELAGARVYKQDKMIMNRYFTSERGIEELLKTTNGALQAMVDVLIDRELSESDIWNAIEKGEQIHISTI